MHFCNFSFLSFFSFLFIFFFNLSMYLYTLIYTLVQYNTKQHRITNCANTYLLTYKEMLVHMKRGVFLCAHAHKLVLPMCIVQECIAASSTSSIKVILMSHHGKKIGQVLGKGIVMQVSAGMTRTCHKIVAKWQVLGMSCVKCRNFLEGID